MDSEKKRKLILASTACLLCLMLMLGGTLAWSSISQTALNEFSGEMKNPGGRLHDDFDGKNKEIYVENFTKQNEGLPILVRVRLYEYMEIGENAGLNVSEKNRTGVEVVGSAAADDIDRHANWDVHYFGQTSAFDTYWSWTLGGSKLYMPTFNLDKESKSSDINGKYDDQPADITAYKTYTETDKTKSDYEIHDGGEKDLEMTEHTAQMTLTQEQAPMSMDAWKAAGSQPGNYWVYDDADGWVYWANPLMPDSATALLLDQVAAKTVIPGKWYYGIFVESQMATADEADIFDSTEEGGGGGVGSDTAKELLAKLAQAAGALSVTSEAYEETVSEVTEAQEPGTASVQLLQADEEPEFSEELPAGESEDEEPVISPEAFADVPEESEGILPEDAESILPEDAEGGLQEESSGEVPEEVISQESSEEENGQGVPGGLATLFGLMKSGVQ